MVTRSRPKKSAERGAAIFIVMMAITLLTGIGLWSMQSAALVDKASGMGRAATQGQYLAELGLQATSSIMSLPGEAMLQDRIARGGFTTGADRCTGTRPGTYCRVFEDSAINSITTAAIPSANNPGTGRALLDQAPGGSFSPIVDPNNIGLSMIEGRFWVEMTDGIEVNVSGNEIGKSGYRRVTLTSHGLLRPRPAVPGVCAANENASAVQSGMRAHVLIGPVERTGRP